MMAAMEPAWRMRLDQWGRFGDWELDQLRSEPRDPARDLAWMAEAWDLARRHDPDWLSDRLTMEHVRHLQRVRAALAVLGRSR
jgi:hypothetical protein